MAAVTDAGSASDLKHLQGGGFRARVQRFGGHLAGMIMPNIGAFIAWGLITALFIPTGWTPNETIGQLVSPMITYLLPLLIGYTGGHMVHGRRGAVIGAVATIGVIVGAEVPMFLGAMIMGPLAAYLLKLIDNALHNKVKAGFEMLVANFSLGILGGIMAIIGLLGVGPIVTSLTRVAGVGVNALVTSGLLPLASIIVEPAKVLFLNNAINQGILTPLGLVQASETGKSILFMVESNPGPGLGVLIAYLLFGPRRLRPSVPGAILVHFFGGIHEIYFPYILMKPRLILATICGGAAGIATALVTGAGLVASPSPGSIIAYTLVTPRGGFLGVYAAILVATLVSLAVASALLGFGRKAGDDEDVPGAETSDAPASDPGADADGLAPTTQAAAGDTAPSSVPVAAGAAGAGVASATSTDTRPSVNGKDVRKLIVACDAGMGSSVMLASQMRKKLKPYNVEVEHSPVNSIPGDAQIVLTQGELADRARNIAPNAVVVPFKQFMGDPAFTRIENAIKDGGEIRG
jgi:mannitol PTS system EIICBA or EIICB component